MSRADGVLAVVLMRRPWEAIRDGEKREEYRGFNWFDKLVNLNGFWTPDYMGSVAPKHFHPYHTLRCYHGYRKDREWFDRPITGIRWGLPNPAWTYGIVPPGPCFCIGIGGAG